MKKLLLSVLLVICFASTLNAGIFRKGPLLPWRHKQWEENKQPSPNPAPALIPPPIVDPTLAPVPDPPQLITIPDTDSEQIKALVDLISSDETPIDTSKYPPWLPLAGGAGGAGIALLALLRKSLGSI